MAKGYISDYKGADYGLDPYLGLSVPTPASSFGLAVDARTANQLKEVSTKLNTGAKAIEVSFLDAQTSESIPKQHLKEINRLRKLIGADLTLHGPTVEPTGVIKQGWVESDREAAERQITSALQRGHELNSDGNIVVTFHASNGLPSPETKVFNEKTKEEELKEFWIVDKRTGQFTNMATLPSYLEQKEGEEKKSPEEIIKEKLKERNEKEWAESLQHINFYAHQGDDMVERALNSDIKDRADIPKETREKLSSILNPEITKKFYGLYAQGKEGEAIKEINKVLSSEPKEDREFAMNQIKSQMKIIENGDLYLRQSYSGFREMFDRVYEVAKKENNKEALEKLNEFRNEFQPGISKIKSDPSKVEELGNTITKGVHLLRSINAPEFLTPLKAFAIDKASDTFSNAAFTTYKEWGDKAPIISIENPPAGMGISRAAEIKEMVEASREKFSKKLVEKKGLSKEDADKAAEKLIGATWDVGHINMLRKYGYGDKQLKEETAKIGKFVNKIHLSDNFGFEHAELPMGMGNVPIKEEMEILNEKIKGGTANVKKIIEAIDWYKHFQSSPFTETLHAFGSPIYSMNLQPYWNQSRMTGGSYFSGYGTNPDVHHSLYGAGFSNLPVELGGQMSGRSRLSGAPIE